jgi:putative CocE/NonD family hydrolase
MARPLRLAWLPLVAACLVPATLLAQPETPEPDPRAEAIRAKYTKYEYRIPMRDGVQLFTVVYVPNDAGVGGKTYPILMTRTPYSVGPYGVEKYRARLGQSEGFEKEGFIFAFQDVRGRYLSEGEFVNMRPQIPAEGRKKAGPKAFDESTDTYDTIDWLLAKVSGNNGKVGMMGTSYPGFYTSAGAIDSHPALKAVSPQAPIADWFWDDMHRHGAFNVVLAFNFFATFGRPRPEPTTESPERFDPETADGYDFFLKLGPLKHADEKYFKGDVAFWTESAGHPNYDEFWQSRNLLPHLRGIRAAVLTVGGWFDTEDLYGPLETYRAIEKQNPGAANSLILGPWPHGGWGRGDGSALGAADFGFKTAATYTEAALAFFVHHLKGGPEPKLPEALVFETGANRWRRFDRWPPKNVEKQTLFFQPGGVLARTAPRETAEAFDEFPSDPAKPVPYTAEITNRWAREYMTEDQRFAARRPDVLVYQTEPLAADLTLAGPLEADLWVSTTGTDADWVVKLIDVQPDAKREPESEEVDRRGQQILVRGEPFRGRFRQSYEKPVAFVPGEPARVKFKINDVFHTFPKGHRVMIQVQSSWFPFIDRNPQTFVPNIFAAEEKDFVKATHRVYRTSDKPSGLVVNVLPAE